MWDHHLITICQVQLEVRESSPHVGQRWALKQQVVFSVSGLIATPRAPPSRVGHI
jgi:hypothetical protein